MTTTHDTTDPHATGPVAAGAGPVRSRFAWRTVDIVVAAVLGVAFGVVFWGWTQVYDWTGSAFTAFPPAGGVLVGVWLIPGVLGGLVVRKPGAAIYTELIAAVVEMLLGSQWGVADVVYGLAQGAAPELLFALFAYRVFRPGIALAGGALAAGFASTLDLYAYHDYPGWSGAWVAAYYAVTMASGLVAAGIGSWWLMRALARTGVLAPFAAGRVQSTV